MTKKDMIKKMIGNRRIKNMDVFWRRALAKPKSYIERLYRFYKEDIKVHPDECPQFCFALLNK